MSTRRLTLAGLVVTLLLAGLVSLYSSASPDGLERVAEDAGFAESGRDSASTDSPLADYAVEGVQDERLSGGLAGVAGAIVVLLVAGGLALALRRRDSSSAERDHADVD